MALNEKMRQPKKRMTPEQVEAYNDQLGASRESIDELLKEMHEVHVSEVSRAAWRAKWLSGNPYV